MRIAVVGSGIAGMTAAHILSRRYEVTVFEAESRPGGHTHTVRVAEGARAIGIDTGFIVFNERNYPNLCRLFEALEVPSHASDMSFSVHCEATRFEYNPSAIGPLLASRRALLDPGHWRMLIDIVRFHRDAPRLLDAGMDERITVGRYLAEAGYGEGFARCYFLPLGASLWSCPAERFRQFPARFVLEFLRHHAMLQIGGRPVWRTVTGGASRYIPKLIAPYRDRLRLGAAVARVRRTRGGVRLRLADGREGDFDEAVIAAHADQALAMVGGPRRRRGRGAALLPLPAKRRRAAHGYRAAAGAHRAVGKLELPYPRAVPRRGDGDVRHESAAAAGDRAPLLRHPESGPRAAPGARHRPAVLRPPAVRAGTGERAVRAPAPHPAPGYLLLRRLLGLRLPRGRGEQRARGGRRIRDGARFMNSRLYEGIVRHRRCAGRHHAFTYRLFMPYFDLDELPRLLDPYWLWSARRPAPAWFRRADYLGPPERPLATAVRDAVQARLGDRPRGPVQILTHLRYLGVCFNPVTFFYCFEPDGARLHSILAEITNTPWGERHAYTLDCRARHGDVHRFEFDKAFHVSPFMTMDHRYHWRFSTPGERLHVAMRNERRGRAVFSAVLRLRARPVNRRTLAAALARHPWMTATVVAGIYWQALRIASKGVRFHPHPKHRIPCGPHRESGR